MERLIDFDKNAFLPLGERGVGEDSWIAAPP
jgi:hypothetical protein